MQHLPVEALMVGLAAWMLTSVAEGAAVAVKDLTEGQVKAIEKAAPEQPPAKPAKPRKVLIYGRLPTHGDPVRDCFKMIEILGRKSGAFETVASGDPAVFLPDNLKQFDAIVMNNTHEASPWLPYDFKDLPPDQQKAATDQEEVLKKSFMDFVSGGKGVVGIHGATCAVKWPEYMELIGARYAGHITGKVWIKVVDPASPLCAVLPAEGFEANDEFYIFGPPFSREKVRVLTALDLDKTKDPEKRPDKDYAMSWVRQFGKGRVFYCSLGHAFSSYTNPHALRHVLAGIQFAMGDLAADATPNPQKE